MLDQSYYEKADAIIEQYGRKPASLIPIMQDIQAEYRYLPGELLKYVADEIGVTRSRAYSVATFYENFSFDAKGKYIIKVCDGTACHVRKSQPVKDAIVKELGLEGKKCTTEDMMFTVMLEMLSSRRMPLGSSMGISYTLSSAKVERSMVPTDRVDI